MAALAYRWRPKQKTADEGIMREETRRKLERALWLDRAKKIGIAVAIWRLSPSFFFYEDYDSHVDNVRVPATVVSIGPLNTTNTQAIEKGLSVDVELANGRHVRRHGLEDDRPSRRRPRRDHRAPAPHRAHQLHLEVAVGSVGLFLADDLDVLAQCLAHVEAPHRDVDDDRQRIAEQQAERPE